MIKFALVLLVLIAAAAVVGVFVFPKISPLKVVLSVFAVGLLIAVLLFGYLYRAAHTLPEGAQPIERDSEGRIKPTGGGVGKP